MRVELQPTDLVSECVIRLIGLEQIEWKDRVHFLGVAGGTMRRVLVDQARARKAGKRDGVHVTLATRHEAGFDKGVDLLALDSALERLGRISPERAQAIELKFFAGMTNEEIAEYMDVSLSTTRRHVRAAKAWLYDALTEPDAGQRSGTP